MTTPLSIGAARDVIVGPIYDTSSPPAPATLAHNAAGIQVWTQVGESAAVDRTASLTNTPGDWYWRDLGGGYHALTIPDTIVASANVGKMLRVSGKATGVLPFTNGESVIVVDPAYVDANNKAIAAIAVAGFGIEVDTSVVPNVLRFRDVETGVLLPQEFAITRAASGGPIIQLLEV